MVSRLNNSDGFTFMEVLVAMVISGTGLLAFASMQAVALKGASMSDGFTTANQLARNVSERILKNAANVIAYDGMIVTGDSLTDKKANCPGLDPMPACLRDFTDWQGSMTRLPAGNLSITSVPAGNFQVVTTRVVWQDIMGSHVISMPFQVAP